MQGTLHFGEDLAERTNYKKIVVEAIHQVCAAVHDRDFV